MLPPTEPCALRSTQPLKMSTRDFSWGKGGQCIWLTTYHPCSAETSRKSRALNYPEPLGPPRPVAGHLYLLVCLLLSCPPMLQSLYKECNLCQVIYYSSLIVLLLLWVTYLVVHFLAPAAQDVFHLYEHYRRKFCVQMLQCLEDPDSRFSTCSLYHLL